MAQRALRAGGSIAIELLLVLPIPFLALMLVIAAVRVADGVWLTLVGSRLAAWAERLSPGTMDSNDLAIAFVGISGDFTKVDLSVSSTSGPSRDADSALSTVLDLSAGGLPVDRSALEVRITEASVQTRGPLWGDTIRKTSVACGEATAEELEIGDSDFRSVVDDVVGPGVLGLGL